MSFPLVVRSIRISLENVDRGLEEAARTLGAGPLDRFFSITLPLIAPGILAGAVTAFAAGLGEFGAVITFASNIPGETRTLPLALYTALQTPDGDALAARLALISLSLGLAGLLVAEFLARRTAPQAGRQLSMLRVQLRKRRGDFSLDVDFGAPDAGSHRAVRPLRLRQVHADLADRRPAVARRRHACRSATTCWSTASATSSVDARHRRIGVVFQDARLFPHLSVLGNLRIRRAAPAARHAARRSASTMWWRCWASARLIGAPPARTLRRREAARGAGSRAAGAAAAAAAR